MNKEYEKKDFIRIHIIDKIIIDICSTLCNGCWKHGESPNHEKVGTYTRYSFIH